MGVFDGFKGKSVLDKVQEYSNKYGEILVGMHQDLMQMKHMIKNAESFMDKIPVYKRLIIGAVVISIISSVLSIITLGVLLWSGK